MRKTHALSAGFTMIELIVALSIVALLSVIAFPSMQGTRDQLRVTDDVRSLAIIFTELRAESIRLKRNTQITFTNDAINWDYYNDGTIDGTYPLASGVTWQTLPNPIIINGFGLVRAAVTDLTLTLEAGGISSSININMNGHISL
jgi:prepilin-type N-terminal cleavage/methylation domain-containing protein